MGNITGTNPKTETKKAAKKETKKQTKKQIKKGAKAVWTDKDSDAALRKEKFFRLFRQEAPFIRDAITQELPSYNLLLSLQAESFDDIALRVIAKQRGEVYDPLNPPIPGCPYCGQRDMVRTKGDHRYRCSRCERDFSATHNAIVSDKKVSDIKFLQTMTAILEGYSQTKTCDMVGITPTTYFKIRNKVLYAMQLMLDPVRLYGTVYADCTFVRISYKGLDLTGNADNDFEEGSMFYDETAFVPREARQRGGSYKKQEWNANSIAILSLRDEFGNTANIFCGTGVLSKKNLAMFVPENKILPCVPEQNPFEFLKQPKQAKKNSKKETKKDYAKKPGDKTLLVIDKEAALEGYARSLGIEFESHVYRDKGIQRKLPEGSHNIQTINSMHQRLKRFLSAHTVSSKYLPAYLLLFDFMEMTGNSKEAVARLLEILATPGLGKPAGFYAERFRVPNFLEQWFAGNHPLKKLPYHQLVAFYLYDHIRNKQKYTDTDITMSYIEQVTGYSSRRIRSNYKNLLNAGYRELILTYFGEITEKKKPPQKPMKTVPPVIPMLHKEWGEYARGERHPRPTLAAFVREQNELYGTSFSQAQMKYWFRQVEKLGVCEPHPPKEEWPPAAPDYPDIDFKLYDQWVALCQGDPASRPTFAQFHREKCKQYQLDYPYSTLKARFQTIEALKLRPSTAHTVTLATTIPTREDLSLCDAYDTLVKEQAGLGSAGMNMEEIRNEIAQKYKLSSDAVLQIVRKVHRYQSQYQLENSPEGYAHYLRNKEERADRKRAGDVPATLQQYNPVAAAKWHPTKNGELTPDQITYGSAKRVWWLCPDCGYEWEAEVRVQARNIKCPSCRRTTREGYAGTVSERPELVAQWHPTKNGGLSPDQVFMGSQKPIWWICEKGHDWKASAARRKNGSGCPICNGKILIPGLNDFASTYPDLAAQWHPTKNGELTPSQVLSGSSKKVWWICPDCGNEWETQVRYRVRGHGCTHCSIATRNQKMVNQRGSLLEKRPDIAAQWHPTKNGDLIPEQIAPGSNKKVWWLCDNGHEWEATVGYRTSYQRQCPICKKLKQE